LGSFYFTEPLQSIFSMETIQIQKMKITHFQNDVTCIFLKI